MTILEHEHSTEAVKERLAAGPRHNYLRDWIYGGIDGSITTFAVVSGVAGAQLLMDYSGARLRKPVCRWLFDGRQ